MVFWLHPRFKKYNINKDTWKKCDTLETFEDVLQLLANSKSKFDFFSNEITTNMKLPRFTKILKRVVNMRMLTLHTCIMLITHMIGFLLNIRMYYN